MGLGPAWSPEDLEILIENQLLSTEVLAEKLGRSVPAIRSAKLRISRGWRSVGTPRVEEKASPGGRTGRVCAKWTAEDSQVITDNWDTTAQELADRLGRSVQSVRNERMRQRRAAGVPVTVPKMEVPEQDLWKRKPGVYEKVVGRLLLEDKECMAAWMHAHGYSSFNITDEDARGWITIVCLKES